MELISKLSTSIASSLAKSLASGVIERWTKYRAERFFEEFKNKLHNNRVSADINTDISYEIDKILSTDIGSEVVFDAYRRVSLANSKSIGPRIIGFLTAELCIEERFANEFEELIFSVAESLNDSELSSVLSTINHWLDISKYQRRGYLADSAYVENDELNYVLEHDVIENIAFVGNTKKIELNIDNLYEQFGSGMHKLKSLGVVTSRVKQTTFSYKEDSERHIDQNGTAQITLNLVSFPLRYRRLLTLIEQMSSDQKP